MRIAGSLTPIKSYSSARLGASRCMAVRLRYWNWHGGGLGFESPQAFLLSSG